MGTGKANMGALQTFIINCFTIMHISLNRLAIFIKGQWYNMVIDRDRYKQRIYQQVNQKALRVYCQPFVKTPGGMEI